ncbi:MAG: DNA-binding response regulator [Candidatus Dadabacteria bacterium]|nr:MAG: DNA-binding response regulator [Candidatus Dadabacteria bacterium]
MLMIRLIVADDHVVMREALSELLESRGRFQVVAQASDGRELLEQLKEKNADVIILDLLMPGLDGIQTMTRLAEERGKVPPVLVLSADKAGSIAKRALEAGAKGFLPKEATLEELEFAIQSVVSGKNYISPSITAELMAEANKPIDEEDPVNKLTNRELEIFIKLADGWNNREIANHLGISVRTVDTHRTNILRKLGCKNNSELTKRAIAYNLIRP